jgi:hypothetical protein
MTSEVPLPVASDAMDGGSNSASRAARMGWNVEEGRAEVILPGTSARDSVRADGRTTTLIFIGSR